MSEPTLSDLMKMKPRSPRTEKRVQASSKDKSRKRLDLRHKVGLALMWEKLTGTKAKISKDEPATMGIGTPNKNAPKEELKPSWKRKVVMHQKPVKRLPLLDRLLAEARVRLAETEPETVPVDVPAKAAPFTFALGMFVEQAGLLAGYSSTAVKFAYTAIAIQAMTCTRTLPKPEDMQANSHGARSAYGNLWLQRDKYVELLREHRGSMSALCVPVTGGKTDKYFYERYIQAKVYGSQNWYFVKRPKKKRRGSRLKRVAFALSSQTEDK